MSNDKASNPIIEKGEHFVITRGFKLHDNAFRIEMVGDGWLKPPTPPQEESSKDRYDRSHEGRIYLALEVCGDAIASKMVYAEYGYKVGETRVINTKDVQVWPVTKQFVDAALNKDSDLNKDSE